MRIIALEIDGFGIFRETSITGVPPGLVLLCGRNEAGKSTLLGFIRTILFGFPRGAAREPAHPPLAGGSHGGRITLLTRDGVEYVVERRPGKGGGPVSVRGSDGRRGGAELLTQILGGVTREVFSHLYAFSLGELQSIETLQDESVKGVIYGASAGMDMLALPRALKALDDRMAGLFKPGGVKPSINARLREVDELRTRLREAAREVGGYDAAQEDLRRLQQQTRALQAETDRLAGERRLLDLTRRLWPSWLDLREAERALRELPEQIERFPQDGLARLDRELLQVRDLEERAAERRRRGDLLRAARAALVVDAGLLARADEVELLLRDLGEDMRRGRELPLKEQEGRRLDDQIRTLLDGLGRDWTEERVLGIDRSLFTREAVRRHLDELRGLETAMRDADTIRAEKELQFTRASEEAAQAGSALENLGAPDEKVDEQVLQSLVHGRSEIAGILRDLPQRAIEREHERQQLERLIREIDPAWTAADLAGFDGSLAARKRTDEHQAQLREAGELSREASVLLRTREEEVRRLREQHRESLGRLEANPVPTGWSRDEVQALAAAIPALRRDLLRRTELEKEIQHQQVRLADHAEETRRLQASVADQDPGGARLTRAALALGAAGAVLAAILLALGNPVAAGISAGLFVLGALVLLILGGRSSRGRGGSGAASEEALFRARKSGADRQAVLQALRDELKKLVESLSPRTALAKIPGPLTWEALEVLEAAVSDAERALERRQRFEEEVQLLARRVALAQSESLKAREEEERAARLFGARQDAWREELATHRLRGELTPELAAVIFGKIEAALERRENLGRLEIRIAEMAAALERYGERARQVPSLAESLRRDGADLIVECDRFFEREVQTRALGEERRRLGLQLQEKTSVLARCRRDLEEAALACGRIAGERAAARVRWQHWLEARELAGDLSPQTALEAFDSVEKCSGAVLLRRGLAAQAADLRAELDRFRSRYARLCAQIDRPLADPERMHHDLEALQRDLEDSLKNRGDQAHLTSQIEQEEAELESLTRQATRSGSAVAAMLREGSAADEEDFRRRGGLFAARASALAASAAAEKNLRQVSGEDDPANIRALLGPLSLEQIRQRDLALETLEREIVVQLEGVREQSAELKHKVERLASADEVARLRAEEERLRAEIRQDALAWATRAVARHLITRAREAFEKEQQPRVIQEAAGFFSTLSCGGYTGLFAPLGEETIEVETANRQRRRPEQLSRGTAEQLYLALRFGFIRTHAERNDPLPVVMDDVLVNFDPERARAAAGAILELSRRQQVLFFTCHPETVDLFRETDPDLRPYRLEAGRVGFLDEARG